MKPLICHINLAGGYRGGERQTELLIRALADMGYDQRLVARKGGRMLECLGGCPGLEIVGIGFPYLCHVAVCRGATLVQAHEPKAGHLACMARTLFGIPYVLTRRTFAPPKVRWRNRRIYRNAAAVTAVSSMIAELLGELGLRSDVQVLADALTDLPVDKVAAKQIRNSFPGKFLLGHAAALVPNKGQIILINAMKLLAEKLPELQLLVMGAGRDEMTLKEAAEGLDNVSFEGHTERLGDYFAALDLYVHPSLQEGLGSVILDAMQAGIPTIASRAGGIPEIVRDGENGLLVPPGDAQALSAAIAKLHGDPELRYELGQRGQAFAQGYTPEVMAENYLQLYQSIGILDLPA